MPKTDNHLLGGNTALVGKGSSQGDRRVALWLGRVGAETAHNQVDLLDGDRFEIVLKIQAERHNLAAIVIKEIAI